MWPAGISEKQSERFLFNMVTLKVALETINVYLPLARHPGTAGIWPVSQGVRIKDANGSPMADLWLLLSATQHNRIGKKSVSLKSAENTISASSGSHS